MRLDRGLVARLSLRQQFSILGSRALRLGFIILMLSLACNVGMLAVPLFNMQVFNRVLPTRELNTLVTLGVGVIIAVLIMASLEILRNRAQEMLGSIMAVRLAPLVIGVASISPKAPTTGRVGMADVRCIREFVSSRACMAPIDLAWAPIMLIALGIMHWSYAGLAIGCIATLLTLNFVGDVLSRNAIRAANEQSQLAFSGAADAVNAADAVLGLGLVPCLLLRWLRSQGQSRRLLRVATMRARAVSAATNALRAGMTGAMVALGLGLALNGFASSGSMVAANMILARLLIPFAGLSATRRQWVEVNAAWGRVRNYIKLQEEWTPDQGHENPRGRLRIENLVFVPADSDRAIVRNVSFSVEAGEAVAVIGPTSSGKSTIARLLVGINRPSGGGVYLDGISACSWDRSQFGRYVGYCPQLPTFLEQSISSNISRMEEPDWPKIIQVCKRLGLHDVICKLPDGYSTKILPGILSGGQRQRLALARALYTSPIVLVLDEPTASLDGKAEDDIIELLRAQKKIGKTIIVVTHRPRAASIADRVVVVQNGAIVQDGAAPEITAKLLRQPVKIRRAANDQAEKQCKIV